MRARRLEHARIEVVLHEVHAGDEPRLLALHPLGASAAFWRGRLDAWPGAAFALDLSGHGASDWRKAAVYSPELFAADADVALAELGRAHLIGAGLGAYVALLLAGARHDQVDAALLLPGDGLEGIGPEPLFPLEPGSFENLLADMRDATAALATRGLDPARALADPWTRVAGIDARPPDYVRAHAEAARRILLVEDGTPRPAWWAALRGLDNVREVAAEGALAALA